jgi:phosphopantothenoylcysteine decarboxylase / phosphopantothenate---cysteine ligase
MLKKIVIACTGSIAVLEIPRLIILLRKAYDCQVHVVLSQGACKFITPFAMSVVAGTPAISADHPSDESLLALCSEAQVLLVAPATADFIARLSIGDACSAVVRLAMLHSGPVIVAPAMNTQMWLHPATRRSVDVLVSRGTRFVWPGLGIEIATFERSTSALAGTDELIQGLLEAA